jgi:hypothetical protein
MRLCFSTDKRVTCLKWRLCGSFQFAALPTADYLLEVAFGPPAAYATVDQFGEIFGR